MVEEDPNSLKETERGKELSLSLLLPSGKANSYVARSLIGCVCIAGADKALPQTAHFSLVFPALRHASDIIRSPR